MFACGQQGVTVGESPAVILDVGELNARGARRFGEGEHFGELLDIAAVNDEIECDSEAMVLQPVEDAEFLGVGFRAGDFIGGVFARALKAQLEMIEAGFDESGDAGVHRAGGPR